MSLYSQRSYRLDDLLSWNLNSVCSLKEGKTKSIPLGIFWANYIIRSIRDLNIFYLFRCILSKLKFNRQFEGPWVIIWALICSGFMTWLLTSLLLNLSCNYFYQRSKGFKVPEVKIMHLGLHFLILEKVSQGTKHRKPIV